MKLVPVRCGLLALALLGYVSRERLQAEQHCIDFRNFSYPLPLSLDEPSDLSWMSTRARTQTIKLTNGVYRLGESTMTLDEVQYGAVTGIDQLNAMVLVGYHTGGTAHWKYVYVCNFSSGDVKLVSWFETGSRAYAGLYRLHASTGGFSIDLFDQAKRDGDCCSSGFIRTTYKWQARKFVVTGRTKYGNVQ